MLSSWVVIKTAFGHPRHLAIQMQCIVAPMIQAYGSMLGFLVPQYGHGLVLCHFLTCGRMMFLVCFMADTVITMLPSGACGTTCSR